MDDLLRFEHVTVCYGNRPALEDVTLSVAPGETVGVVGQSGCGKSTLIRAAMGLLSGGGRVVGGRILFRGEDLRMLSPERMRCLRGRQMGMVFQNCTASLCPVRTIWDQMRQTAGRELGVKETRRRALELLERMGLSEGEQILASYPFELSGGMNQRVGVALALLLRPALLFADEPTSALDVITQKQVARQLLQLTHDCGTALVIVTHNIDLAAWMSDRVAVLCQGRVIECGGAEQVLGMPQQSYTRQLIAAVPRLGRT